MLPVLAGVLALLVYGFVLWDVFETVVLPRRIRRGIRVTSIVYRLTWKPWRGIARKIRQVQRREFFLSLYGPLSLIVLLASWVIILLLSFGVIQWALGSHLNTPDNYRPTFGTDLYLSGTTIFTLGLGDISPQTPLARLALVVEGGTGFGILAMVIGYLPVIYQAFSRRETNISLLDARAGSPPVATELLRRHDQEHKDDMIAFLRDWERWAAELLESHLSYPSLGFFRSQHDRQSWVGALTMILDATALVQSGLIAKPIKPALYTFAMARHAMVDLSQIFATTVDGIPDRLPPGDLDRVLHALRSAGIAINDTSEGRQKLTYLRGMYEPYAHALSGELDMELPPWLPAEGGHDDWQTSMWEHDVDNLSTNDAIDDAVSLG